MSLFIFGHIIHRLCLEQLVGITVQVLRTGEWTDLGKKLANSTIIKRFCKTMFTRRRTECTSPYINGKLADTLVASIQAIKLVTT